MIFLNLKSCLEVQMSLATVFCVPSCHLNVTETVCVQHLSFLYMLGNLYCPLQGGLLHVNVRLLMETLICKDSLLLRGRREL